RQLTYKEKDTEPEKNQDRKAENMIDMAFVSRFCSGDKEAFYGLVTRYKGQVFGIVRKFFSNQQDTEDISQEIFINLFKALPGFRGSSMFFTWFYRLIINTCLHHKRGIRHKEALMPERKEAYLEIPDYSGNPLALIEKKEFSGKLQEALNVLPGNLKAALVLREIEGLSYGEIAAVQGVSLGTVKSRIHNGRVLLGEELKKRVQNSEDQE
ncbi:MAG: sigma-70 family RNA polymerase sigma factor, partial [Candidatus Firestonebacteria bacterium]